MTAEIEKQFFEAFEIEKKQVDCEQPERIYCSKSGCKTCKYSVYDYPSITDRILLELICKAQSRFDLNFRNLCFDKIENLKYAVLDQILEYENRKYNHSIKQQVKSLFKEGE